MSNFDAFLLRCIRDDAKFARTIGKIGKVRQYRVIFEKDGKQIVRPMRDYGEAEGYMLSCQNAVDLGTISNLQLQGQCCEHGWHKVDKAGLCITCLHYNKLAREANPAAFEIAL